MQGNYDLKNSVWHNAGALIASSAQLLRSYSANCDGRNIELGNTTLLTTSDHPSGGVLLGDLIIEGLTFRSSMQGQAITATATAETGTALGATSEFSACFPYTDDTIVANGFETIGILF